MGYYSRDICAVRREMLLRPDAALVGILSDALQDAGLPRSFREHWKADGTDAERINLSMWVTAVAMPAKDSPEPGTPAHLVSQDYWAFIEIPCLACAVHASSPVAGAELRLYSAAGRLGAERLVFTEGDLWAGREYWTHNDGRTDLWTVGRENYHSAQHYYLDTPQPRWQPAVHRLPGGSAVSAEEATELVLISIDRMIRLALRAEEGV